MDPFELMDLFEVDEAPGHQETLKIHYKMIATGFLLSFGLVMENRNHWQAGGHLNVKLWK